MTLTDEQVIYTAFLPKTKLNIDYCKKQWKNICDNNPRPCDDFFGKCDRDWDVNKMGMEEKMLLGFTKRK